MNVRTQLATLGIELPPLMAPLASYVLTRKVGADVTAEEARASARTCALDAAVEVEMIVEVDH